MIRPLDENEKKIFGAFLKSSSNIKSDVAYHKLVAAIASGDPENVITAMALDSAAFSELRLRFAEIFENGGSIFSGRIIKAQNDVFRFDIQKFNAQRFMASKDVQIQGLVGEQKDIVREILTRSIRSKTSMNEAILQLAGRVDRRTGKRTGGVIGLSERQFQTIERLRDDLTSNDPKRIKRVLSLDLRDPRFDAIIKRSVKDGVPIPAAKINAILNRYQARALRQRAQTIAYTEATTAFNAGQIASAEQAISAGIVDEKLLTKEWQSRGDNLVRGSHIFLNRKKVGFKEKFTSYGGVQIAYPGDPDAPQEEIVNCRCSMKIDLDFKRGLNDGR